MDIKINNGKYEVINSGTIVNNLNETIEFCFKPATFIFEFRTNKEKPDTTILQEKITNESNKVVLVNFNNSIGNRNVRPVQIGTHNGYPLYVNFEASLLSNNAGHILHYTFFIEKSK